MKYLQQAPFNVRTGGRAEKDCQDEHWRDPRGRCVFCGKDLRQLDLPLGDAFVSTTVHHPLEVHCVNRGVNK